MKQSALSKLGRSKKSRGRFDWLDKQQQPEHSSAGKLLDISFSEWCETVQIKTPEGLQPFRLFPWQKSFADLIIGPEALTRRSFTLLSSRQTGKTSLMLALAAYLCQARRQFTVIFVHRTSADAYLLCRRLKRFLNDVPLKSDSLSLLEFAESGSLIYFRSANPAKADGGENVARGVDHADCAFVDEASFLRNLPQVKGSLLPTMTWSRYGQMVFIGTASSKQSIYYEQLARSAGSEEALENTLSGIREGHVEPFQVLAPSEGPVGVITNWRAIEQFAAEPDFLGRIQNEFDLEDKQIASEYELIFDSSVDSAVFDFAAVMAAQTETFNKFDAQRDTVCYLGVDPSGAGKDYAVAIAIRAYTLPHGEGREITHYEVCHMYRRRTGTAEQHLAHIANLVETIKPICTVVERNSMGQVWGESLAGIGLDTMVEGFSTTQQSKEVLIGRLSLALEMGVLHIPKGPIVDELLAFRRDDRGRMGASGKSHDDCTMALAFALKAARFHEA